MGLGPSTHPRCKSTLCENHQQVKYILRSDDIGYEKSHHPWFINKNLTNNVSTYWACDSCFHLVNDPNIFIYNPDYVIHGM